METKEKAYAKINLALAVGGKKDGFHEVDGIAVTVDLYDQVVVSKRRDDLVKLYPTGLREYVYDCIPQRDNAYKAAVAFMENYSVGGVDIRIRKAIPLGGGMGGSSTDAAAVLRAMAKLYGVTDDLSPLANALGSDTAYLLKGGFARLKGRGEIIESLDVKRRLHIVAVYSERGVNTTKCFEKFDELGGGTVGSDNVDRLKEFLLSDSTDFKSGLSYCKNDLFEAARLIEPQVGLAFDELKSLCPSACFMTGAGSTVCAIFSEEPLARWAVDKMKRKRFGAEYLYSVNP